MILFICLKNKKRVSRVGLLCYGFSHPDGWEHHKQPTTDLPLYIKIAYNYMYCQEGKSNLL